MRRRFPSVVDELCCVGSPTGWFMDKIQDFWLRQSFSFSLASLSRFLLVACQVGARGLASGLVQSFFCWSRLVAVARTGYFMAGWLPSLFACGAEGHPRKTAAS